jgi:hypothetical protein
MNYLCFEPLFFFLWLEVLKYFFIYFFVLLLGVLVFLGIGYLIFRSPKSLVIAYIKTLL